MHMHIRIQRFFLKRNTHCTSSQLHQGYLKMPITFRRHPRGAGMACDQSLYSVPGIPEKIVIMLAYSFTYRWCNAVKQYSFPVGWNVRGCFMDCCTSTYFDISWNTNSILGDDGVVRNTNDMNCDISPKMNCMKFSKILLTLIALSFCLTIYMAFMHWDKTDYVIWGGDYPAVRPPFLLSTFQAGHLFCRLTGQLSYLG